jgi:hypothetical protein
MVQYPVLRSSSPVDIGSFVAIVFALVFAAVAVSPDRATHIVLRSHL